MRTRPGLAIVLAALALAAGCSQPDETPAGPPAFGVTPGPLPSRSAETRLCFGPTAAGATTYREVPCTDPAAEAYEVERVDATLLMDGKYQPDCPDSYDFALDVEAAPPVKVDESVNRTFSCVRRLEGPHATDPGGGRKPIVFGDCVAETGRSDLGPIEQIHYAEIPCAEAGAHDEAWKVVDLTERPDCPDDSRHLSFTISPLLPSTTSDVTYVCAEAL